MLIDPTRVTLRPGNDRRFLNIDYNHREIGHLEYGQLVAAWAIHYEYRPLVELVAECHRAFSCSPTASDLADKPRERATLRILTAGQNPPHPGPGERPCGRFHEHERPAPSGTERTSAAVGAASLPGGSLHRRADRGNQSRVGGVRGVQEDPGEPAGVQAPAHNRGRAMDRRRACDLAHRAARPGPT